jgi:hypothetical protein
MVTFLKVRFPVVGRVGMTDRCSFSIIGRGKEHELGTFHYLGYMGNLGVLVVIDPHHEGPIDHKPWPTSHGSWPVDMPYSPMVCRLLW